MIGKPFLILVTLLLLYHEDRTSSFVAAAPKHAAKSDLQSVPYDILDLHKVRIKRQDEVPMEDGSGEAPEEVLEEVPEEAPDEWQLPEDEYDDYNDLPEEAPEEETIDEETIDEEVPEEGAVEEITEVEEAPETVDETPPVEGEDDIEALLGLDGDQVEAEEGSGDTAETSESPESDLSDVSSILGLDEEATAVLEPPIIEAPTTPAPFCSTTPHGCCTTNDTLPAHGEREEGCCLSSEFGCCPDQITFAAGPEQEGCSCEQTDYGCCPDQITAARGQDNLGCGCSHSPFGCCPDQVTISPGKLQTNQVQK